MQTMSAVSLTLAFQKSTSYTHQSTTQAWINLTRKQRSVHMPTRRSKSNQSWLAAIKALLLLGLTNFGASLLLVCILGPQVCLSTWRCLSRFVDFACCGAIIAVARTSVVCLWGLMAVWSWSKQSVLSVVLMVWRLSVDCSRGGDGMTRTI